MTALALYWLFLRVVLLSFSGFATVPLLRESLVLDHGVLTVAQLNDAIAISQSSPGAWVCMSWSSGPSSRDCPERSPA